MSFIDTQQIQHRNVAYTTNSAAREYKSNSNFSATRPMRRGTDLMVDRKAAATM